MTINEMIVDMMGTGACKDFMTFLSIHAKGNVLHMGMCEKACGITALLHGLEGHGGHLWTINPYVTDRLKLDPFMGHPQWTLIESDPLDYNFLRSSDIPEEIDMMYVNAAADKFNTLLTLRSWGPRLKATGLMIISGVKGSDAIREACEEFAKSYGMKFHPRQAEADLGVIFYPDNKEALKHE